MTVAAIVLAGGAARRFGGDKLAAELEGRTLLARAVEATAAAADLVVVAVAHDAPDPDLAVAAGIRLVVVRDVTADGGPLAGLIAGLEAAVDAGAGRAVVVGGDMPWLRPELLKALVAGLDDTVADACAPVVDGARRPLPVGLRVGPALVAARARLADGRRSLTAPLDVLRTVVLAEAAWRAIDPDGASFRDVDRPADLGRAGQEETGDPVR